MFHVKQKKGKEKRKMKKKLILKDRYFNLLLFLNLLGGLGYLVANIDISLIISIAIALNTVILVKFGGIK